MGASESLLSRQQLPIDEITTVSERIEGVDPLLERVGALKIVKPLLDSPPAADSIFTDIPVKKSSSIATSGALNPKVLLELFSTYRQWQEEKAKKISNKQEEIEINIETADALALKLLQRFNYSVSAMRSIARSLAEVNQLQVEVGELTGRLTEVISNCDTLCKRIDAVGPESLRPSLNQVKNIETQTTSCSKNKLAE